VVADLDIDDVQDYLELSGAEDFIDFLSNPELAEDAEHFQLARQRAMVRIMAHGGRDALDYIQDGTRPQHVLLTGPGHWGAEGFDYDLPAEFAAAGLNIEAEVLPNNNDMRAAYLAMTREQEAGEASAVEEDGIEDAVIVDEASTDVVVITDDTTGGEIS